MLAKPRPRCFHCTQAIENDDRQKSMFIKGEVRYFHMICVEDILRVTVTEEIARDQEYTRRMNEKLRMQELSEKMAQEIKWRLR